MRDKTCRSLLGIVVKGIGHEGQNIWVGGGWADIAHGGKFLHIAFGDTRETSAFGEISLALRGSGASSAAFEVPSAPIRETTAVGGGKRKKNLGHLWRLKFRVPTTPV